MLTDKIDESVTFQTIGFVVAWDSDGDFRQNFSQSPMRAAAFALSFPNDAQISGGILSKKEQVGPA